MIYSDTLPNTVSLNSAECQCIEDLQNQVDKEIETNISTQDFINFFKHC